MTVIDMLQRARQQGRERGDMIEQPDRMVRVREVPLVQIQVNPQQQRRYFDPAALEQLAVSIREKGVLQPILLRPVGDRYEIVFGERRWRAAQLAGLTTIPAQVREMDDREAAVHGAIENLQRRDVSRWEDVNFKLLLLQLEFGLEREEMMTLLRSNYYKPDVEVTLRLVTLFDLLGGETWESFTSNGLPVMNLSPLLVEVLKRGEVEHSKVVLIARVPEADQLPLLERVKKGMTMEQLREEVARLKLKDQAPDESRERLSFVRRHLTLTRMRKLPEEQREQVNQLLKALEGILEAESGREKTP